VKVSLSDLLFHLKEIGHDPVHLRGHEAGKYGGSCESMLAAMTVMEVHAVCHLVEGGASPTKAQAAVRGWAPLQEAV
jgi:hypothetical protein